MPVLIEAIVCNVFGDFKVGDNTVYNADVLCELINKNEDGVFNKIIVMQIASIMEVAFAQIFYRARNFNVEGVPNISEDDRSSIADKQIDKLAVIIDNLRKYHILDEMGGDIYNELHKLRKYRNKIHIQSEIDIDGLPRDELDLFNDELRDWAISLNWNIMNYLAQNYSRPQHIRGYVSPINLPRLE
ncbi:hypothetical protein [Brucella anthropi]|uniref:HEPN AbiU2-like domain-containing protein n=1 Tax=Brucella anthropi TaxID=529 RepID=A0A6L3YY35_BRUAN|nr:hypothetical protein [Brucella anthropi]KAB2755670.1 hypothetical protein F9L04_25800 [Brucella anthropi]UVV70354.1 hypothetical protein NW321_17595 [Brucella anthropi]